MSGGLASFLSVEDWTSSKEVLCQRFNTEEHGWARERYRLSVWKWLQAVALPAPKFFGRTTYYDLKRATIFYLDIAYQSTKW